MDLSPVSVRNLLNSYHPFGLMSIQDKYPCKRFSTLARVGGAGFRLLGRIDHHRNLHFERVYVVYTRRSIPFQFWLGRGRPLNPYLSGLIIDFLRKEMKPQQLSLIPDQMFAAGPVKDFLEWTTLRGWMKQWLQYCKWYYGTALSPEVTIQDFFDAPVVNRKWWTDSTDPKLVRFGLLWKVYDMVGQRGLDFQVPILESNLSLPDFYLLGGH